MRLEPDRNIWESEGILQEAKLNQEVEEDLEIEITIES